jgi:glucosamine--fructose-6-phosphate aminotransferase (isomerizing)
MGRKYLYPIALEGALKLKEISYIHAEGYPGGELKHGPIALVEPGFPVVFLAVRDSMYERNLAGMEEVKARGGVVIAIATQTDNRIKSLADEVIYIPRCLEMLSPILAVVPLQLLAYYAGLKRGLDVDRPRNLAKSVTVE